MKIASYHRVMEFKLKNVCQIKEGQTILDGIDLEIPAGKLTALIGPSGAGKTSLLRLLSRLDDPASGEIFYENLPITEFPVQQLRREVGFVFQSPVMFPGTVADNLKKTLEFCTPPMINRQSAESVISEMMTLAGIDAAFTDRDAAKLSLGQKQRVSIARALMTFPKVLLMDEPTSALDPQTADKLMESIRRLTRERKLTVLMITHRLSEARKMSDLTVFMEAGRIIEAGDTETIFERSENERVREFIRNEK
jgi:putative ABC transport system ATP-binding protein